MSNMPHARATKQRVGVDFLTDPDMKKDSNTQRTLLSRTLDVCNDVLEERGLDMPEHVVFHADNTPKEHKNQASSSQQHMSLITAHPQRSLGN